MYDFPRYFSFGGFVSAGIVSLNAFFNILGLAYVVAVQGRGV